MIGLLEKLIGLISVGTALANISVLRRFLAGVATVIALTIISSVMAGLLIVFAFYGIYDLLVHAGVDPEASLGIVALLATAVTALLGLTTMRKISELQNFAAMHKQSEMPAVQRVQSVLTAFANGMLKSRDAPENVVPMPTKRYN